MLTIFSEGTITMPSNALSIVLFCAASVVISVLFLAAAIVAFGECHERNRRRKLGLEAYNE